jgi:endonuclease-3
MNPTTTIESPLLIVVLDRLETVWGMETHPPDRSFGSPLDGLIATLLSQNTNDRNSEKAFYEMKRRWPRWEKVVEAGGEELVDSIRIAGLAPTKASRIREILFKIKEDFGIYGLDDLRTWEPGKARAYLENLPGIGPKTAGCVLAFELKMPSFPVDTHVARITRRLGWFTSKQPATEIQSELEKSVPTERQAGGHLNFILHGRNTCHARKPFCGKCILSDICPSRTSQGEPDR